ncbi:histidinol dehydrogenase, partial [Campylobacter jejuni]
MQILVYDNLDEKQKEEALKRPAISAKDEISKIVSSIIKEVQEKGDKALIEQALKFDKAEISKIKITQEEITQASNRLDKDLQEAILVAYENIKKFHEAQIPHEIALETTKGVKCEVLTRP